MRMVRAAFYILGAAFELSGILLLAAPDLVPGAIGAAGWLRTRWPGVANLIRARLGLKRPPKHEARWAHDTSEINDSASAVVRSGAKSMEEAVSFLMRRDQEAQHAINSLAQRTNRLEQQVEREARSIRDFVEGRIGERVAAAQADYRIARLFGVGCLVAGLVLTTLANFIRSTKLGPITMGDMPEWLTAVAGLGAFAATVYLARAAFGQMVTVEEQTRAVKDQAEFAREAARHEATAVAKQIEASIAQSNAIRDAARVMIQARVIGHVTGPAITGPNDDWSISPDDVAFQYRLVNEGSGPALNVRHGVELGSKEYEWGGGMETRSLAPGEASPPFNGALGSYRPLAVVTPRGELPNRWTIVGYTIWARFDNALGERYETRNPSDPQKIATFSRITDARR